MKELTWRDAIIKVLSGQTEPMHYTDVAEAIASAGLRSEIGATPAATVNATIAVDLQRDKSPFVRVAPGYYTLREGPSAKATSPAVPGKEHEDETGLINAFGMYWARSGVLWSEVAPRLLGQQQAGSTKVDFSKQRGVYLLHDGRAVVYVGRTTDQPLGVRLRQHGFDRLNGRWDRFSWFGIYPVAEDGSLNTSAGNGYTQETLITTMEALLIEGLEPPQNRKRGDDFRAIEFLQVEDPMIQKEQLLQLMDDLRRKL